MKREQLEQEIESEGGFDRWLARKEATLSNDDRAQYQANLDALYAQSIRAGSGLPGLWYFGLILVGGLIVGVILAAWVVNYPCADFGDILRACP